MKSSQSIFGLPCWRPWFVQGSRAVLKNSGKDKKRALETQIGDDAIPRARPRARGWM
jgi:hypothetical protein